MEFISIRAIGSALLPPLNLLLLAGFGLLLLPLRRKAGTALLAVSLAGLCLLSMPIVAFTLAGLLENHPRDGGENIRDAQAIVILGGGSYPAASEYGGDTVGPVTLERVRWGARLHHSSGLPILVSGGSPFATGTSEAAQMKAALNQDFHAEVKWLEEKSVNTFENARYARQQLSAEKIDRIALVTHAIHMRRARLAFERAGFRVIEAPTGFSTQLPPGILKYVPTSQGLQLSAVFFHEIIGLGWYHARLAGTQRQDAAGPKDQQ